MNLSDLLEDSNKDLVIIYPGRFHAVPHWTR